VTGGAGFIGGHLAEEFVHDGHDVVVLDTLEPFYDRGIKEHNIEAGESAAHDGDGTYEFIEGSVTDAAVVADMVENVDVIFHQAAQAGVRASWGKSFRIYTDNNVLATQRLLEAARRAEPRKVVYASSSSVYGEGRDRPTREGDPKRPLSPYGVTKLACEHLCHLYEHNYGVPTLSLRYFTVYGPMGRPDMSVWRFAEAILRGDQVVIYGDGTQSRGFTYVDDVVEANLLAAASRYTDRAFNVGGASSATVNELLAMIEEILGREASIRYEPFAKGDARKTLADMTRSRRMLGLTVRTSLAEGLPPAIESIRQYYGL
ncbi:MAG: NAD-dependent epimerase/dehydratase family protein, partial [Planctomycetota bacterium]